MSVLKEGSLKIKLQNHAKWHRRFCTIDWDKSMLFIATRSDTRYKDWIKLLPTILINDFDSSANFESHTHVLLYTIGLRVEDGTATHLFQADTKEDYESWLIALRRTAYSRIGGGIFGQSLEDTYQYSLDKTSLVPVIIRECCEYLLEYGLNFVGLLRVPGKQSSVKKLRELYDRGLPVEFKTYSPATISSLLKIYLQSLPEPIIPTKYFDEFLELGSRFKYNQNNDLDSLKQLMEETLSKVNHAVLAYLCLFLKKLTDHVQITKMDTDNLAVVFGNNLIRPAEELDLDVIKGNNYNLLPLIKVLIDHSESLFWNISMSQYQDSYEQTIESVTKSSGFSSFSSLLSSNENLITKKSRSSSMPSIYMATRLSADSGDISLESRLDGEKSKRRTDLFHEKEHSETFDYSNLHSSIESDEMHRSAIQHQRFSASSDDQRNHRSMYCSSEEKGQGDDPFHQMMARSTPIPVRKTDKHPSRKAFANKFGKSLSSIKSSMSKALQSHGSSTDHESEPHDSTSNCESDRRSIDSTHTLRKLLNDIDILHELLNKKDLLITELTKTAREERLHFENVKAQLNEKIQQLQNENHRLQSQLNMQ